ncbi:MAG: hypothetical protein ABIK39_05740 [candidate division WOR-3 bacterium]
MTVVNSTNLTGRISRNLAFVGAGGVRYVLNVKSPANPVKLSEAIHTRGSVEGLAQESNRHYIAAGEVGLELWDVTNPTTPTRLGSCNTPSRAYGVAVAGNYAYVADEEANLRIIEFYGGGIEEYFPPTANRSRQTATIVRSTLFLSRKVSALSREPVLLLDITGRKVLDLKPGTNDIRHLSPGVYFIRTHSTFVNQQEAQKVIVAE